MSSEPAQEQRVNEPTASKHPRAKEAAKWLVPIGLALLVVCAGCSFFLAAGLVARGELTTTVLGTDFRLWSINEKAQTGLGLQRSYAMQQGGQACHHFDVTFLIWRPRLSLDSVAYDQCP